MYKTCVGLPMIKTMVHLSKNGSFHLNGFLHHVFFPKRGWSSSHSSFEHVQNISCGCWCRDSLYLSLDLEMGDPENQHHRLLSRLVVPTLHPL